MDYRSKQFRRIRRLFKDNEELKNLFLESNGYNQTKGNGHRYVNRICITLSDVEDDQLDNLCNVLQITKSQLFRFALQRITDEIEPYINSDDVTRLEYQK